MTIETFTRYLPDFRNRMVRHVAYLNAFLAAVFTLFLTVITLATQNWINFVALAMPIVLTFKVYVLYPWADRLVTRNNL